MRVGADHPGASPEFMAAIDGITTEWTMFAHKANHPSAIWLIVDQHKHRDLNALSHFMECGRISQRIMRGPVFTEVEIRLSGVPPCCP